MDKPKVSYSQLRLVIPPLGEPLPTLRKKDPTGSVTLFVYWIEDYPLPDGLKMPSHVGSYDENGDLDNCLHLFEGAIRMNDSNAENGNEGVKKVRETSPSNIEGVLGCINAEERIIVNNKYPEQTVPIRKQLPEHFKERLQNILRTNVDVFAWTHDDMTGIPRTITVNGKPINTDHKLNEYSHIKPIKQKRRSLDLDHRTIARKEVEELTRAGILREAVHQTWVANPVMVKKTDG
ncbi:hypothetical protein Tco_0987169 [Tanacetum coccineum]